MFGVRSKTLSLTSALASSPHRRHAGDWGNLVAGDDGRVTATLTSELVSLDAASSANIVSLVALLHADADDGVTQPTGNAGARLGCSVIVRQQ